MELNCRQSGSRTGRFGLGGLKRFVTAFVPSSAEASWFCSPSPRSVPLERRFSFCRVSHPACRRENALESSAALETLHQIELKSLSEKGARLCRRPAATHGKLLNAPRIRGVLRLVEDDTAALRDFQTGSNDSFRRGWKPVTTAGRETRRYNHCHAGSGTRHISPLKRSNSRSLPRTIGDIDSRRRSTRMVAAGVLVYRLGHGPLKAERRVRFPCALPILFPTNRINSFVSYSGFANKLAPRSGANLAFRRSTLRIMPSASNPVSAQVDGSGTVINDAMKYASPAWLPPDTTGIQTAF